MRECDFAGKDIVVVGHIGMRIYCAVLQLHYKSHSKLINVKLIPQNAKSVSNPLGVLAIEFFCNMMFRKFFKIT